MALIRPIPTSAGGDIFAPDSGVVGYYTSGTAYTKSDITFTKGTSFTAIPSCQYTAQCMLNVSDCTSLVKPSGNIPMSVLGIKADGTSVATFLATSQAHTIDITDYKYIIISCASTGTVSAQTVTIS